MAEVQCPRCQQSKITIKQAANMIATLSRASGFLSFSVVSGHGVSGWCLPRCLSGYFTL